MKKYTLFLLLFISYCSMGQDSGSVIYYLEKGHSAMAREHYSESKKYLDSMFMLKQAVPDSAAFLYGKALFKVGQFHQSEVLLNKYKAISPKGQYITEAVEILKSIELNRCELCSNRGWVETKVPCALCDSSGVIHSGCTNCSEGSYVLCSRCSGQGVVKVEKAFGAFFEECSVCEGEGTLPCRICGGDKVKEELCSICSGNGFTYKRETCQH